MVGRWQLVDRGGRGAGVDGGCWFAGCRVALSSGSLPRCSAPLFSSHPPPNPHHLCPQALGTSPIVRALFDPEGGMRDIRALDNISFTDWFKSHGGSDASIKRMWDPIGESSDQSFGLVSWNSGFRQVAGGWWLVALHWVVAGDSELISQL